MNILWVLGLEENLELFQGSKEEEFPVYFFPPTNQTLVRTW